MEPLSTQAETNAVNTEEWKDVMIKYKNSKDPVECTEALTKGRLYYLTLSIKEKETFFGDLSNTYRNYFATIRENISEEDKNDLVEIFEEAVEDWAGLNDALDTFIGLKEPDDLKKKRLEDCEARGRLIFESLPASVNKVFHEQMEKTEFKEFLQREFGNVEIINYLKENEEMKEAREALIEEDKTNPFFDETISILNKIMGGRDLTKKASADDSQETDNSDPTLKEFSEIVKDAKKSKDFETVLSYLTGLNIDGLTKPASNTYDAWLDEMKKYEKEQTQENPTFKGIYALFKTLQL